jgi:hypothetical protein
MKRREREIEYVMGVPRQEKDNGGVALIVRASPVWMYRMEEPNSTVRRDVIYS